MIEKDSATHIKRFPGNAHILRKPLDKNMIQNCMKQKIRKIIINEPLFVVYLAGVLKKIRRNKSNSNHVKMFLDSYPLHKK